MHKADAGGGLWYLPTDFSRGGAALTQDKELPYRVCSLFCRQLASKRKTMKTFTEKNAPFFFFFFILHTKKVANLLHSAVRIKFQEHSPGLPEAPHRTATLACSLKHGCIQTMISVALWELQAIKQLSFNTGRLQATLNSHRPRDVMDSPQRRQHLLPGRDKSRPAEVHSRAAPSPRKATAAFHSCLRPVLEKQAPDRLPQRATWLSPKRTLSQDVRTSAAGCCVPQVQELCSVRFPWFLRSTGVCGFCCEITMASGSAKE